MRKLPILLLAAVICWSLCGCMKTEAAQAVDDQILALGEITLDSKDDIEDVDTLIQTLSEKEQKQLDNIPKLEEAKQQYDALVVDGVQQKISQIGTVSLRSETDIKRAREAYEAIPEELQKQVANYDALTAAEEELIEMQISNVESKIEEIGTVTLDSESKIKAAKTLYQKCSETVRTSVSNYKALVDAEDKYAELKANQVAQKISAIGTVTMNSHAAIKEAEAAYNSLSGIEKGKVSNIKVLTDAKQQFKTLKNNAGKAALANMRKQVDQVEGVTWYFSPRCPVYMDTRSYMYPLIGQMQNLVGPGYGYQLHIAFNYAGSNWINFEDVVVSIDGKNHNYSFSFYDVQRQLGYTNDVIEYAQQTNCGVSDIDMLWDIVSSNKTIVRFSGDRYYDLVLNQADKNAIRDVLLAYEYIENNN